MTRSRLVALVASVLVLLAGIGLGLWYYGDGKKSAPVVSKPASKTSVPATTSAAKKQEEKKEEPHKPEKYLFYRIKEGDTLSGISRKFGIDQKTVAADNKLNDPGKIYAGKTLALRLSAIKKPPKLKAEIKPKAKAEKVVKKAAPQKKKVVSKKSKWAAFKEWVFSLWKYPGKNAYKGCMKTKEPENVHEALVAMLKNTEYKDLIPVFEDKVKKGEFTLKDIQKGEVFDFMVSTKKGKTVVGRNIKEAWDPKWVKKHKISRKAERYSQEFRGNLVTLTLPYACCNWAITITPLPPPPPAVKPKKSWLEITKEIFSGDTGERLRDTEGNLLSVPAFHFIITDLLTGGKLEVEMAASGYIKLELSPSDYQVDESHHPQWEMFARLPSDGRVTLRAGETKSVNFKNQQIPPARKIPPVTELPPEEVPPEITSPPVAPPAPPITELPTLKVPGEELKKLVSCYGLEHEPSTGTGGWENGLARGHFVWGDHVSWYQGKCGDPIWLGMGFFGAYDSGKSRVSPFKWRGHRVSPNFAVKGYYPYITDEGEERYRSFQLKLRFPAYDVQRGGNGSAVPKIKSTQRTFPMLGTWVEGEQKISETWTVGMFGDLWVAFRSKTHANFSARRDRRDSFMLGFWAQKKIGDNWDARLIIAPFWQGWDNLYGFHIRPEARYRDSVIFGPFANLFPRRSAIYRKGGTSLRKLQTWGGFVRLELRGPLGKLYDVERSSEVVYTTDKTDDAKAFEDEVAPETTTQTLQGPSEIEKAPELQNVKYSQPGMDNPEILKDLPSGLE